MISYLKTYMISLSQLTICLIIVSPFATILMLIFSQLNGTNTLGIEEIVHLSLTSSILIPLTSTPLFIFIICPYISFLKRNNLKSAKYWVFGLSYIALIFPVTMHALKFLFLEALGLYNILIAYFGIYVTLYAYYGVHTLSTIFVSVLMYKILTSGTKNLNKKHQ